MQTLNICDCCKGLLTETPVRVYNRPGLNAISYRTGNYTQFRESLLARLSASGLWALRQLTTRDNDDFTIALLNAWAVVSDVLTFYQERIANEAYLGTATEQLSITELARLIGYELRPGVAASTYLAFTLDENTSAAAILAPGTPQKKPELASLQIETGVKVQSIPGPGEDPQTFETIKPIAARPEWNSIKPRLTQPQFSIKDNTVVVISGTGNDLKVGDVVLIRDGLRVKKILKLDLKEDTNTTFLYFSPELILPTFTLPPHVPTGAIQNFPLKTALTQDIIQELIKNTWTEEDFSNLVQTQGWSEADLTESIAEELARQATAKDAIYVFRKRAAVLGYNAMEQVTYNDKGVPSFTEWTLDEAEDTIFLDSTYEQILPGSYIAIQKSTDNLDDDNNTVTVLTAARVDIRPQRKYGISARSTQVSFPGEAQIWWEYSDDNDISSIRSITVHAQSTPLMLSETPIREAVGGDIIMLGQLYTGLKKNKTIIVSGERTDLMGVSCTEVRMLKEVYVVQGMTMIVLDKPLTYAYIRTSVSINANVATATHGETTSESLGSGNAAKGFQKFLLRQPPLTFISAPTPSGTLSTLEIRVNDLLWHEVPSLYNHTSGEHIYTTRQDDAGKTTVLFGDGKNGARVPTGQENIQATYRKGIGTGGLVKANQLSQLISRPTGIKGVTNPVAASGAEDREQQAAARRNATLTIFTLDRIVSLLDYEDFARSFAGITKSLATWTWNGKKRAVFVTIAGANGAAIASTSKTYGDLLKAIAAAGIPEVAVTVESFRPRFFRVKANIAIHPDYITEKVIADVKQLLLDLFSFTARAFGQPVAYSEVIAAMQQVPGVIAVDLALLYRAGEPASTSNLIGAAIPVPSRDKPLPAELLMIDPGGIDLQTII